MVSKVICNNLIVMSLDVMMSWDIFGCHDVMVMSWRCMMEIHN